MVRYDIRRILVVLDNYPIMMKHPLYNSVNKQTILY